MIHLIHQEFTKELDRPQNRKSNDTNDLKQELEKSETELSNLINFIKSGNTYSSLSLEIEKLENEIRSIKHNIKSQKEDKNSDSVVTKKYICKRLKDLNSLFMRTDESLKTVQMELKSLLNGRIAVLFEDKGDHYETQGVIKTKLSSLLAQKGSLSIYGGGGNRTPFLRCGTRTYALL